MTQPTNIDYKQKALDHVRSVCPELQPPKYLPLPVKYDGMRYYWGKDGEMVADFDEGVNTGDGFRIRGWGRIQNEERQDECAKWIEKAINLGHTPHLEHFIAAMHLKSPEVTLIASAFDGFVQLANWSGDDDEGPVETEIHYNLTKDGKNQSQEFYKAYCEITNCI